MQYYKTADLRSFVKNCAERIGDEMTETLDRMKDVAKNDQVSLSDVEFVLQHDGALIAEFHRQTKEIYDSSSATAAA